jgi:hypothetical protein
LPCELGCMLEKYTNKKLDLFSYCISIMGSPVYKVKEISHVTLVF